MTIAPALPSRHVSAGRRAAHTLLALAALATVARAQQTMRFEPIGVYELEIDGKVAPKARMFHSPQAAAVLVISDSLPYPIAAVPRNKTIQQLDPADLVDEPRGSVAWTPKQQPSAVAGYELVEDKPVFEIDGRKIRFLDKQPLLGPKTREEIVEYDPSYAYRMATADPPTTYLGDLESWPKKVRVKIFFSTQCQVCRELLPGIFKTIDRIKNPNFSFEYYGLPLAATKDPVGKELGIHDFPTGILYDADGNEIARASGHSWRIPDMAIHNALAGIQIDPEKLRVPPESVPRR